MASIKQITDRKYKITISNGYRTDGRKICMAKTIQIPDAIPKRIYRGHPIKEKTAQKYLTVVSAVLSDAKRNEIIEKNPARMIDLPDAERKTQEIPTMEEMQQFLSALCYEEPVFQLFYFLAVSTGLRRSELCAL